METIIEREYTMEIKGELEKTAHILVKTSETGASPNDLAKHFRVSISTIYSRITALRKKFGLKIIQKAGRYHISDTPQEIIDSMPKNFTGIVVKLPNDNTVLVNQNSVNPFPDLPFTVPMGPIPPGKEDQFVNLVMEGAWCLKCAKALVDVAKEGEKLKILLRKGVTAI